MKDSALVVVDMLYDFIDGSMACKNASEAVSSSLAFIDKMTSEELDGPDVIEAGFPILFVCDNHPRNHCSFVSEGGPWPEHCVQGTHGAEIHSSLKPYAKPHLTFFKGRDPKKEQYSGFEGVNAAGQSLGEVLDLMDIRNVYVCGIATEYCVRNTCEDLLKAGFNVWLLNECLGYVKYEDHLAALSAMEKEGIRLTLK
jgi:nicotinamidase-related amidase